MRIGWRFGGVLPSCNGMPLLGAILAGGQARRFGSDKAHARYNGWRLIDLAADALSAQCDGLVICGREEAGFTCIPDRPKADMGPLGGINAALHYAAGNGFDRVLSVACDIPNIPADLARAMAGDGAAIVQSQPVVGLWPVELAGALDDFLAEGGRKLFDFAGCVDARLVRFDPPLLNINRPEDLPE